MKTGIVFDIQRFSLYDGPGIRTTVFLKGCPLRCKWCHNPESQSFQPQLSFNREKCVNCLACVNTCIYGAQQSKDGLHSVDHSLCRACGNCINMCSYDALKIIGKEWTVEAVISEAEHDIAYYRNSGGGITISGGEPTAQYEFTLELLKAAKQKEIHTCVETCGYAAREKYKELMTYTDLLLFDYKETDPKKHKELTGVSNELILSNLDYLYTAGAPIILRCPLIPGVNDSIEHLKGIAEISARYPKLAGLEIMPYHDMGNGKSTQIGREIQLPGLKTASEEIKAHWIDTLKRMGCKVVRLG